MILLFYPKIDSDFLMNMQKSFRNRILLAKTIFEAQTFVVHDRNSRFYNYALLNCWIEH